MRSSRIYSKTKVGFNPLCLIWRALAVSLLALGTVNIQAQHSWGLKDRNNQFWQQGRSGLGGFPKGILNANDGNDVNDFIHMGNRFGQAVASADFNGDGFMDLAVGAPDDDSPLAERFVQGKGAVTIIYGSRIGLDSFNTQRLTQGANGVAGSRDNRDRFGFALAAGDFNGDSYADLAIGVPGENAPSTTSEPVSDFAGEGAVNVIYGGPNGLQSSNGPVAQTRIWQQGTCDAPETGSNRCLEGHQGASDHFGEVLAAGDFDGDNVDDLAISVPGNGDTKGAVAIIYGGHAYGLAASNGPHGNQLISQNYCDAASLGGACLEGASEANDRFGSSLVAADFTGDQVDDLAIGTPNENSEAGAVNVIYGKTGEGLLAANGTLGDTLIQQGVCDPASMGGTCLKGNPEGKDLFGAALAAGDFDRNGFYDLAIGAPGEDSGRGVVSVIYGGTTGLRAANGVGNQIWSQDSPDMRSESENGDHFGAALTAGDFRGNGFHDLVIGVPDENRQINDPEGAGSIDVIYGNMNGLHARNAPGNQFWTQNVSDILDEEGAYFDTFNKGTADQFGSALATGDFNGDGVSDLAIGVPGEGDNFTLEAGDAGAVSVLYGNPMDRTPPEIQAVFAGDVGSSGEWYVSNVKVGWKIEDSESAVIGLDLLSIIPTTPCPTVEVGNTGPGGRAVTCTATSEGGTSTSTRTVLVDTGHPVLFPRFNPVQNSEEWNNTSVTVSVNCLDLPNGSGISRCSEGKTFTTTGIHSFQIEGADVAGNFTREQVPVRIDKIAPTIDGVTIKPLSSFVMLQNSVVTFTPNASDNLSGIASKSCEQPKTTTPGDKSLTCKATDKAGNVVTRSFAYTVVPNSNINGVNIASSINGVATASWGSGGLGVGSTNSVSVVALGNGTATVAGYFQNPVSPAGFNTSNAFSLVDFEEGHNFRSATITNCRLGGGNLAYWSKDGVWQLVSDQTYDRAKGCLTIKVNGTTSPSISDLTGGAYFGIKNTEDQMLELITLVDSFNLRKSSVQKFSHGLDKALEAARRGDTGGICKELEWFIKKVNQATRKQLTTEEAGQLLAIANRSRSMSGCR